MSRKFRFAIHCSLLVVMLLAFFLAAPTKEAAAITMFCRSDPLIVLSNGRVIDVSADIGTLLFNVEEVHYEIHGPQGTSMIVAVHTPTWLTSQETFVYIADQPAGQYYATVIARTSDPGEVPVNANFLLLSPLGLRLGYQVASGFQDQVIRVDMRG